VEGCGAVCLVETNRTLCIKRARFMNMKRFDDANCARW
jgi:hypothetical protein